MTSSSPSSPPEDLKRRGPGLSRLIDALCARESLDAASIGQALREHPVDFDDVRTFIRFDPVNYVRSLVYRDERFEVRLLCWRPGQASSLHGHDKSACAFRIIRGAATEIVVGERDRIYAPGTVVEERRGDRVHQVMNAEHDPLLSLHVYSPPLPIDAPSDRRGHEVVIIGGGLSGAAAAYHLLKHGDRDLRVSMIERGPFLGRGIAYGVESDVFRLNVPAARMSIDPSVPDDFVKYAGAEQTPNAFLSRSLYGAYVGDRLGRVIRENPGKMRVYRDEAVHVRHNAEGGVVTLRSGLALQARKVILATGLSPRMTAGSTDSRVVDAWDECSLGSLPRYGRLLLLGSGLSALDVLAWLEHTSFRGTIRIASPRGLLPLPHREPMQHSKAHPREVIDEMPKALGARIRWFRDRIREAEQSGDGFQSAMDKVRPHIETLYRSLSGHDRAQFLRHVRPYWEVFRHRAPVESLARVKRWQDEGRLVRTAGRVVHEDRSGEQIRVVIRARSGEMINDSFDAIVRCIGPALSLKDSMTTLTRSLLDDELAMIDSSGLGLATDPQGRVLDGGGEGSSFLFGLGAVRRASSWETTSVPDISVQAQAVAKLCLG